MLRFQNSPSANHTIPSCLQLLEFPLFPAHRPEMRLAQFLAEARLADQFAAGDFTAGFAVALVDGFLDEIVGEVEQANMRRLRAEAVNDHLAVCAGIDLLCLQPEMLDGAAGILQEILAGHPALEKCLNQHNVGGAPAN